MIPGSSVTIDSSSVNVNQVWSYIVTYNVSDSSGNSAIEVTRVVTIEDTTPPVITILGNATETMFEYTV